MTLKTFIIGMFVSFGLAWMCMIAIPVAVTGAGATVKMSDDEDAAYYQHKSSGRLLNGAEIYNGNGCYTCHSQLIRPTYAGQQIFRKESVAGRYYKSQGKDDPKEEIDTRRETSFDDYAGLKYAPIGLMRVGPDLSNLAYRVEDYATTVGMTPEKWLFEHLYDPRNEELRRGSNGEKINMVWSNCPSQKHMFKRVAKNGQGNSFAISKPCGKKHKKNNKVTIPDEEARVLVSYLLSFKRDDTQPDSLNYGKKDEE